jgi:hypothetical protein
MGNSVAKAIPTETDRIPNHYVGNIRMGDYSYDIAIDPKVHKNSRSTIFEISDVFKETIQKELNEGRDVKEISIRYEDLK